MVAGGSDFKSIGMITTLEVPSKDNAPSTALSHVVGDET